MPDVVATASREQLLTSTEHVVLVCAVLGEFDFRSDGSWFLNNPQDDDPTTNSLLQVVSDSESDLATWQAMDEATLEVLQKVLSPKGAGSVEYWHGAPDEGAWAKEPPSKAVRPIDALAHENSTLHIGDDDTAPVDLPTRLCGSGSGNVYVTGGVLWLQGGS